jgi:hypothetical protein
MVEGIRQRDGEDDEAFLLRAESVMEMEEKAIRDRARHLVAMSVRACDKPESLPEQEQTVRRMASGPSFFISVRALLLARSMCRELQSAATGPDPTAQQAYELLSRLTLEALEAE